ncbi:MAG: SAM-dependent methyltransferase [Thermoanaerobacteraceae bacterium]|nr:SAM-dependent methyltransferase [Thermoanaerobacteraceae bacterium]
MEQEIKRLIKQNGPITFRDFMEQALYNPEKGYYTAHRAQLGREGDFYTSVHVSPLFGGMLGRQAAEVFAILDYPRSFTIIEFGAGDGMLAKDILSWLEKEHKDCFAALEYRIVEISPRLRDKQKETLEGYLSKVDWVDSEALAAGEPVEGMVLSNELVDAFPVHLVRKCWGQWQESWVTVDDRGELQQVWDRASRDFNGYFELLDWFPQEGQTVEVNFGALDWLELVACSLKRGVVITIDYGYLAEELEAPQRFDGTLLCYHRHRVVEDPLQNIGRQDITSHANFTALMKHGIKLSLKTAGFMTQSKFLLNLGIMQVVEEMSRTDRQEAYKQALAVKKLAFPEGMGEIFKVLVQYKGLTNPRLRCLVPFYKQLR